MNKTLARTGALMLLMNPFVQEAQAQVEPSAEADKQLTSLRLSQSELDQLHQIQTEAFKFDPQNRFSYLKQGCAFVPKIHEKPDDFSLQEDTWKSLSVSLDSAKQFDSKEKLNTAIKELREKEIRLEFKVHPRLMAFMIANNHLSQADIDANKDDLIFLLSQENHLLKSRYPNGNAKAHSQAPSLITSPVTTPSHVYENQKKTEVNLINKFIDDFYRDSKEKKRLQSVLKDLGFTDYTGFSPMTFMQMAKDYDLVHHPDKFKELVSSLNLDSDKPIKVNFAINILADESADHNACFARSMINPEKAWESAMKFTAKPVLLKDGSVTLVLGVRENKADIGKLLNRLSSFFDQVDVDKGNLQINMMAHGSYDAKTKKGAIHLSQKDDEENKTLSDKDLELYGRIAKVFEGTDKCHLNLMSCFSGKHIAAVIAQEMLSGLSKSSNLEEFSFSAPYDAGVFSGEVSQEGLTQYDDNGVSAFRYKNYFPRLGTIEYQQKFEKMEKLAVK